MRQGTGKVSGGAAGRAALLALMAGVALAGCAVPRGAALQSEVLASSDAENPGFATYAVTRAFLPALAGWPATGGGTAATWLPASGGAAGQIIAPGDMIELTVWENVENGLLTRPGERASNLQTSVVSAQGNVFVPYLGPVKVAGMSPDHAREVIQSRLESLIPSPQVQLVSEPGPSNSVDVVTGVAKPGKLPMLDRSMTVLGAIAQAGGALPSIENAQVSLHRGGHVYSIGLDRLVENASYDTLLRAGDKLIVGPDKRSFVALGATGVQRLVNFPKERLSALEAVSLAGGLDGNRADPGGLLVLREYAPAAVIADAQRTSLAAPRQERVVFTIDLTTADGLFSAGKFPIYPQDVVLATESPVNDAVKIAGLLSLSALGYNRITDR